MRTPKGDVVALAKAGSTFGKYRIKRLLGRGGMGEVHEAYDTSKDRTVALKILTDELARDPEFRTRFQRESRAAAMLEEPHVIPIHDWGEIEGNLYIDMRLVRGENLHDMLQRGPLEPARAVAIIRQVASALDAAHAQRLIHRDIKPQNILVTGSEDFAYLIDFGIAESRGDTRLTSTGSAIGSFSYIAPERFSDRPATPAVDTYSLACVLYEALTGAAPFKAGSIEQVIAAHISAPPPKASAVNPRVPAALDEVIARGMAKEPDDRYGSPGALGRAAERALDNAPPKASDRSSQTATQAAPPQAGPTLAAWQLAQPQSPVARQSARAQTQPWVVPAAIVGGLAVVLGAIGIAVALNSGHDAAAPTGAAPTTGYTIPSAPQSNSPEDQPPPSAGPAPYTPNAPSTSAATSSIARPPGTDQYGWIGYPGARCATGTQPAALVRTTQSVVVVCEIGPGSFYYRGVRLSDGAGIELANAVRSSVGFDVTNPSDGTRYQIRPNTLSIISPSGKASTEPVIDYSSI
ncbi:serine/threonine-protein kinase [Mycobacterium sp.]|uniref:serine/threonine-protein kinase n=1 Tax=Mycobacterium sp. TaxID=1785 RepID=UPI0025EFAB28|nr:serine/threonine-protein kinase [Mycobacterium sp.]